MSRDADQTAMMAECMVMVRQDLIEAGVIDASVAPIFVADAVCAAINDLNDRIKIAEDTARHWRLNHDNQVQRARILIERPDLPIERVDAYQLIAHLQEQLAKHENISRGDRRTILAAQRFAACRHAARDMPEEGGDEAFIEAVDKYREEHGI